MRQTTRTLSSLAGVGAGIALGTLAYARWVERMRIEVKRMEVMVDSPGVPAGGLRILHLSDMHFTGRDRTERLKIERTIKLLGREQVDLLLITGDLIHDTGGLPAALDLIERLPRPRLGAFACLGNHDYSCYSWLGPARVAWREAEPGREMQAAVQRTIEMVARVFKNDRLYLGQDHNDVDALKHALWQHGVFKEVREPNRLVFTFVWEEEGERGIENLVTIEFEDRGSKTQMTFRHAPFVSVGERDGHSYGWSSAFDRLDDHLAQ